MWQSLLWRGSSKTTCMMQAASVLRDRKVTILTYNRALCDEAKARCQRLGLNNCACCTIHALVAKCAGTLCQNDDRLLSIVESWERGDTAPIPISADLVLLDEVQVCTLIRSCVQSTHAHTLHPPTHPHAHARTYTRTHAHGI